MIAKFLAFQKRGDVPVVLTHSHRSYAYPLLAKRGLDKVFPPSHIFDIVAINGGSKQDEKTYPYVLSQLQHLGPFKKRLMLDDMHLNLKQAKVADIVTMHVHPEAAPSDIDYIDHAFPCTHEALDYIEKSF